MTRDQIKSGSTALLFPIAFKPSYFKNLGMFLTCLFFTLSSYFLKDKDHPELIFAFYLFGAGVVIWIVPNIPGSFSLRIEYDRVILKSFFITRTILFKDIQEFGIFYTQNIPFIGFKYRDRSQIGFWSKLSRASSGFDGGIANQFRVGTIELCDLLERARQENTRTS